MIFCSKNEKGEPAWKLILKGEKTVTRRLKQIEIGKIRAVQPGRGKKAVGKIRIISCKKHNEWLKEILHKYTEKKRDLAYVLSEAMWEAEKDAQREGFLFFGSLVSWLESHNIKLEDTYRIEFELIK